MCIHHLIGYSCSHTVPLDTNPSLCLSPTNIPCHPIATATFLSDDVCDACSGLFLGLIGRSIERLVKRSQGVEVQEIDLELDEVEREGLENWLERGRAWGRLEVVKGLLMGRLLGPDV